MRTGRVETLPSKQAGKVKTRVIEVLALESPYHLDETETWPVDRFMLAFRRCVVLCFEVVERAVNC